MAEEILNQKQMESKFKSIVKTLRKAILKVEGSIFGVGVVTSLVSLGGAIYAEVANHHILGDVLFCVTGAVTALNVFNFAKTLIKNKKIKMLEMADENNREEVANKLASDKNPQVSYCAQTLKDIDNYSKVKDRPVFTCNPEMADYSYKNLMSDRINQRLKLIENGLISDDQGLTRIN